MSNLYFKAFSLVLSLGLVLGETLIATASINPNSPSQGSNSSPANLLAQGRSRLRFRVPGVRATQGRRTGGFARGPSTEGTCNGEPITVTALLPQNNRAQIPQDQIEVEKTLSVNPTFLVHMTETKAREAQFTVLDASMENVIYDETIPLTGNEGIVSLTIPKDNDANKSLQVGQSYYWALTVDCGDPQTNPMVDGRVEVVPKTGALAGVDQMSADKRLEVYADNGIWTDLASELAQLYETNPQMWQADWDSVLQSVGLTSAIDQTSASAPGTPGNN